MFNTIRKPNEELTHYDLSYIHVGRKLKTYEKKLNIRIFVAHS